MLQAQATGELSGLELPDGYETTSSGSSPIELLKPEILCIFDAVRFWEKGIDWLQVLPLPFNFVMIIIMITSIESYRGWYCIEQIEAEEGGI